MIKAYGLLSVAVLAILFIGILEIIAHKFPQASTPYRPPTSPAVSNVVNVTTTSSPVVQKRQEQARLAVIAPPNACGFSQDLTEACLATGCLDPQLDAATTPYACADNCIKLGIWPYEPRHLCPRQTPTCGGYTSTLNDNCRNYCYSHEVGNPFNATDATCGNYCAAHSMQPYEVQNCATGGSPIGTPAASATPAAGSASPAVGLNNLPSPVIESNPTPVSVIGLTPPSSPTPEYSPTPNGPTPEEPPPSSMFVVRSVVVVSQAPSPVLPSVVVASSVQPALSSIVIVPSVVVSPSPLPLSPSPLPLSPSALPISPSALPVSPSAQVVASSMAVSASPLPISPLAAASVAASEVLPSASANILSASPIAQSDIIPSASVQSNLFVSAASDLVSPIASVVPVASVVAASPAIQPPISVQPEASQQPVVAPVVPIIAPANLATENLQNTNTPPQLADPPVNPANAPITVAVVPDTAGAPSTVVINNPSVVLPLLGVQTVASSVVFTNAAGQVVTQPVTVFTSVPDALVPPPNALVTRASSILVTNAQGQVSTVPVNVISPARNTGAPILAAADRNNPNTSPDQPSSASSRDGSSAGSGGGSGSSGGGGAGEVGQGTLQKSSFTISVSKTFSGGYLPILIARAAHWGWSSVHGQLSAYEPFVQMSQSGGASGTVLLGPSFSAMWPSFVAYAAVVVLSPLAPETFVFDTSYCSNPNVNDPVNPCYPAKVSTNMPIIRTLESLLALIAFMAILSAYKAFKKPTGVSADPTCIVAVASVLHHPRVVNDFQSVSGEATDQDLKQFLETKKYKLGTYVTENGSERYGIIPVEKEDDPSGALDLAWSPHGQQDTSQTTDSSSKWTVLRMWKSISVYLDGIFLLFIVAVMCIAASYVRWVDRSVLARMFQFSNVGRRIVFTCIGMIVSSNWGRLLSDTQTVSPYLTLARQDAPAKQSILIPKHNTALTSVLPALFRKQHTTFLVAFTALLAEFLVVALSGLPIRPGSTRDEFFFCGISALVILAVMVIVLLVVNMWRRALPHLPRKPDSTGSVMTYLADSRMLRDFEGIERMRTSERDRWIETLGNRYEYVTKRSATTGQEKWTVDATGKAGADDDVESTSSSRNPVVHSMHIPATDARFGPGHATPLAPPAINTSPVHSSSSSVVSHFDHS